MSKWEMVRLGDVCHAESSSIAQKDLESNKGRYPIYGASGLIKYVDFFKQAKPYIAIVKDGAGVGRVGMLPENSSIIGTMQYIIPNERVALSYLYSAMANMNLAKHYSGATIPHIYFKDYKAETLLLPPLAEQQKIATELDKISGLITKRKSQIEKLDVLVKAKFVEMFGDPVTNPMGWRKVRLGAVADLKTGPFGSLLHKEDYIKGGHPLVNPSHIIDDKVEPDNNLTLAEDMYHGLSAYHLKINDIVLGRRGEMGRCAVVKVGGMLCGTGSLIIRANSQMKPFTLQKIISYPTFKKKIEEASVGVTMMNLNVPIVSNFQIPLLPLERQTQFVYFVQKTEQTKTAMQKGLAGLETLYKSRMQECFE